MHADIAPLRKPGRPRTTGPGHTVGVRLPPRTLTALDHVITEEGTGNTRAGLMREIIEGWLEENGVLAEISPHLR